MRVELNAKNPPIDPKEIELFELGTGYKLPDDYKQFLLDQNGGIIKTKYKTDDKQFIFFHKVYIHNKERKDLEHFIYEFIGFNILSPDKVGIYRYFVYDEEIDDDPYSVEDYGHYGVQLVIAHGHDYKTTTLCLSPEKNYGKIYVFDDHCDYDQTYENCAKISDSFEEFMNTFELVEYDDS